MGDDCGLEPPAASSCGVRVLVEEHQSTFEIPALCDAEGHYIVPEHGSLVIHGVKHCVFVMVAVRKASSDSTSQLSDGNVGHGHGHGFRYLTRVKPRQVKRKVVVHLDDIVRDERIELEARDCMRVSLFNAKMRPTYLFFDVFHAVQRQVVYY